MPSGKRPPVSRTFRIRELEQGGSSSGNDFCFLPGRLAFKASCTAARVDYGSAGVALTFSAWLWLRGEVRALAVNVVSDPLREGHRCILDLDVE